VQRQGKIVTNKVFLVRHSNIGQSAMVTCYIAGVGMTLDEGHYIYFLL